MYVYHYEEPMGASRNFIRGVKSPPPPPPVEKRGPKREESSRKAPCTWQKIPLKKKKHSRNAPPPLPREKAPHKEKISSKKPPLEKKILIFQ